MDGLVVVQDADGPPRLAADLALPSDLGNYAQVFADKKVTRAVISSLIVAVCSTGLSVLLAAPAAYALARYEFRGKADLWFWFISNRLISPIVLALPIYMHRPQSGSSTRISVLILIYLTFILPIVVWIITDYFRSIPSELEEAARLEGASQFDIFWRIYVPLGVPGVAVSAIFGFIFSWNELLYALVLIAARTSRRRRWSRPRSCPATKCPGARSWRRDGDRATRHRLRVARPPAHGARADDGSDQVSYLRFCRASRSASVRSSHQGRHIEAEKGEFVVFVGPSGCGKSTLLRMIAGLEELTGGDIEIDGRNVNEVDAGRARRRDGVPDLRALSAHDACDENIGFALQAWRRSAKAEIAERVAEAARILQMEALAAPQARASFPAASASASPSAAPSCATPRSSCSTSRCPTSTRNCASQMRVEIAKLHHDLGATMIYVTHDQIEAMTLADQIVVLRAGTIEQVGTPQQLYEDPDNLFVAGFIGSPRMNFLERRPARADGASLTLSHPSFPAPVRAPNGAATAGGELLLGLRPEQLHFEDGPCRIRLTADLCENLGGATLIHGQTANGEAMTLQTPGRRMLKKGEAFSAGFDPAGAYLFAPDGRAL